MTKKAEEILDLRKKNPAQSLRRCLGRDDECVLCGLRLGVAFGGVDGFYFADIYVVQISFFGAVMTIVRLCVYKLVGAQSRLVEFATNQNQAGFSEGDEIVG